MPEQISLGVLAPFLGGWYFGGLLDGIAHAAGESGANVIAIQTLDAGTNEVEITRPSDPACRTAWDHVAGFIVVVNAVSAGYLRGVEAAGKPVVVVSHEFDALACPVVQPDNGPGIRAAVEHLVQHGHRRIAFVGCLRTADIRERHQAYRQALLAHGLQPDDALVFGADDNQESGGERAARAMLAAGVPSTAVIAGTDATAIGMMRTLSAAGLQLPRDQAVIGFDDGPAAAFTTPRLSSVQQPVQTIARSAVAALLGRLAEPGTGFVRHRVPTELVVRESCGCLGHRSPAAAVPVAASGGPQRRYPTDPGAPRHDLDRAGHRTVTAAGRAELLRDLGRVTTLLDGGAAAAAGPVTDSMQSMVLALMPAADESPPPVRFQHPQQAQFTDSSHLQAALSTQYEVSMDLLRGHEEDPRQLAWLGRTSARAGCLGLWAPDRSPSADDPALQVVGSFGLASAGSAPAMPVAAFPPPELLAACREQAGRVLFLVPVKVNRSDWGVLAIVDTVETKVATGREPISQWTALLAVALDHQDMLGALREREAQLRRAALYDHLTGLPNRAMFLDRLAQAIGGGARSPAGQLAVLFLDLDEFKVINDCLGHSVGDWLLVQVADRVRAGLRDCDTAARFGGDEFLILLDGVADAHAATQVAERLHTALARPFQVAGQDVVLTASIGIALGGGRDYQRAEDLLRDADLAMYCAKSQDKGSHAVFDVAMHAKAVSRLQIETELRQALARDEFAVYYQPINQLGTGRTYGFEALVRWRHPTRGLVAPDDFLPVAEQTGLILPLSRWILAEACRQVASWQAAGAGPELSLSVNISNRQFWQSPLVHDVAEVLRETGLPARSLALEITEGVIMRDVERACVLLEGLHALGCRVHIDDFGTGYSSLEALHRLPIDALKIDRSFVSRLGRNRRSGEFVRTIVLMGHNLGIDLIAEGIETEEHRDLLVEFACPLGQGYLYSRPVPASQAETFALNPPPH